MADQRTGWWQTVPGFLTAAAAFIAALTGLLAGLNQLGLLDRPGEPVEQTGTVPYPAPGDTVRRAVAAPEPADTDPRPPPAATQPAPRPRPAPRAEAPQPRPAVPAPVAPAPAGDTAPPVRDTASAAADTAVEGADTVVEGADTAPVVQPAPTATDAVLPRGTVLELAAGTRVCSTTSGEGDRFHATLVVPIAVESGVALPVGATAVLEVERLPAPTFVGVRLDSIVREGRAVAVRKAEIRVRGREFVAGAGEEGVGVGACIPAGGRITAKLTAPVRLGES